MPSPGLSPPGTVQDVSREPTQPTDYWTCAQVYTSREYKAVNCLRRQGFETFFPLLLTRSYGKVNISSAFPGYVFVRLKPELQWYAIKYTRGVIRLLMVKGNEYATPYRVPNSFISSMKRIVITKNLNRVLPIGTKVRIKTGVFQSKFALVEKSDRERVCLLLDFLGRNIEVELYLEDVESYETV